MPIFQVASLVVPYLFVRHPSKRRNINAVSEKAQAKVETLASALKNEVTTEETTEAVETTKEASKEETETAKVDGDVTKLDVSAVERIAFELGNDLVQEFLKQDTLATKKYEIGLKLDINIHEINRMKIPELKDFLSSQGLIKGGSKPTLIARVDKHLGKTKF